MVNLKQLASALLGVFPLFLTNSLKAQTTDTTKTSEFEVTLATQDYSYVKLDTTAGAFIQTMPEFPGGPRELFNYIRQNLNYPKKARKENISGKVLVEFIIDEKGNVTDEKVVEGIGGGCDEEALRVVRLLPRWKPGRKNGVPDKVKYKLPFVFNL